jgi:hypothetical protein
MALNARKIMIEYANGRDGGFYLAVVIVMLD